MSLRESMFSQISPEEMRRRKMMKKGLQLTILVCGRSGTGKATFINTLCNKKVIERDPFATELAGNDPGIQIRTHHADVVEESSTPISLTVVDTPGFGENINNEDCCGIIVQYIEEQFDAVLSEECRINRNPRFVDNRVHVALYFIQPTGRGLKEPDIQFMKTLGDHVNIIPVIGRSDSLTESELQYSKACIRRDIERWNIPVYSFTESQDDRDSLEESHELQQMIPFAVVGSENQIEIDGKMRNAIEYPWGIVKVDDPNQSDFLALKSVLFGSFLSEFKELTHNVLYEKYRSSRLTLNISALAQNLHQ